MSIELAARMAPLIRHPAVDPLADGMKTGNPPERTQEQVECWRQVECVPDRLRSTPSPAIGPDQPGLLQPALGGHISQKKVGLGAEQRRLPQTVAASQAHGPACRPCS